jgi:RNA polymerase sigma factor (sigma-70 family)
MTLNKNVESLYKSWRQIAGQITRSSVKADDLLHTVIESLYQCRPCTDMPASELNAYVIRCMKLSYISTRSRYHYLYRKPAELVTLTDQDLPEPDAPDQDQRAQNETADIMMSRLSELDSMLMRMYVMPGFSYEHLSLATGIPKEYIYQRIKISTRRLKQYAQNQSKPTDSR